MNELDILWEGREEESWAGTFREFFLQALEALGARAWEISVTFCDDGFIRKLNRDYRGKDEPTDVLSFVQDPADRPDFQGTESPVLGDLILSLDTLPVNAAYFQVPAEEELKRLSIHGILHLQGWDHRTNDPGEPMLQRQEEILKAFAGVKIFK